jgi:XTP/dITP diphosphohydrolase
MNNAPSYPQNSVPALAKLYLASSNPEKLDEFRALASAATPGLPLQLELLPDFKSLPSFAEDAPTFAENATGKALHYSRFCDEPVFADDSGLVVPSLGGLPGVKSARYAGPQATAEQRNLKLLAAMRDKIGAARRAYFVCAIALAQSGQAKAIVTDRADGEILVEPRGRGGFGYDPVFYFPPLKKSFAEISREEKNKYSHRGRAFSKLLAFLNS